MENKETIEDNYKRAVAGLNAIVLNDKDLWYSYIINLPTHLQVTYTIIVFHQQVFNGGLHQYFFNSYGQFAYLTLDHLRLIKAWTTADILCRALKKVNIEGYSLYEFRDRVYNRQLDRIVNFEVILGDSLNRLDSEYDSLNENVEQLLLEYLNNTCK
ncbi:MAG TPA: DUF4375 domain-containing protein [Chitinophagaceae bacterium]